MPEGIEDPQGSATVAPSRFLLEPYLGVTITGKRKRRDKTKITPYCLGMALPEDVNFLRLVRTHMVSRTLFENFDRDPSASQLERTDDFANRRDREEARLETLASDDYRHDTFFSGQAGYLSKLAEQADKKDLCTAFDNFGHYISRGDPQGTSVSWSEFFDLASVGQHEDIELMSHDLEGKLYTRMRAVRSRLFYLAPKLTGTSPSRYESCDNPHISGTAQALETCPKCKDPSSDQVHFKIFVQPIHDKINDFYETKRGQLDKDTSAHINFIEKESSLSDDLAYAWYLHQSHLPYADRLKPNLSHQSRISRLTTAGPKEAIWRPKYISMYQVVIPPSPSEILSSLSEDLRQEMPDWLTPRKDTGDEAITGTRADD